MSHFFVCMLQDDACTIRTQKLAIMLKVSEHFLNLKYHTLLPYILIISKGIVQYAHSSIL